MPIEAYNPWLTKNPVQLETVYCKQEWKYIAFTITSIAVAFFTGPFGLFAVTTGMISSYFTVPLVIVSSIALQIAKTSIGNFKEYKQKQREEKEIYSLNTESVLKKYKINLQIDFPKTDSQNATLIKNLKNRFIIDLSKYNTAEDQLQKLTEIFKKKKQNLTKQKDQILQNAKPVFRTEHEINQIQKLAKQIDQVKRITACQILHLTDLYHAIKNPNDKRTLKTIGNFNSYMQTIELPFPIQEEQIFLHNIVFITKFKSCITIDQILPSKDQVVTKIKNLSQRLFPDQNSSSENQLVS